VRAYIANDSDSAGDACKVVESLQCSDGIVQDGGGVTPGNDLVDDKAIKKRADDSDARVSEFVCSSGIHRASLRLCKLIQGGSTLGASSFRRSSSGSFAMLAAMRRASSRVSS
jgi:hypothetical protein